MDILSLSDVQTYKIALILSNIFTVFISKKFFSLYHSEEKNPIITKVLYVLYGVAVSISSVIIDVPIINLIVTILTVSAISFSYKNRMNKILLLIAFYCSILFAGEILSATITGRIGIQPLVKGGYHDIFGLLLCKILTLIVVLLLENSKIYKGNHTPPTIYLLTTLLMPTSSIVLGAMIMSINGVTKPIVLFSMGILMLINVLIFSLYDKISVYYDKLMKAMIIKQENKFYQSQLESMDETVNETRSFRHDIINHFSMVEGYLKANRTQDALSYVQELRKSDILSERSILDTGNFIVDSVLNYKLSEIQDMEIQPELEIFVPEVLNIDTVHFVSILTNIMDNAIDALRAMPTSAHKILRIRIVFSKGRLMMLFQNSFSGDIVYENGNICSSKKNKVVHGYGLENIRKALEPYHGLLKIFHSRGVFSVQVILYLR